MIQRDESIPEHIDTLLDALTNANAKQPDDSQITADIVTWRGIMTKILCTPYSRKEPWELRATKHNVNRHLHRDHDGEQCHLHIFYREASTWKSK